MRPTGTGFAPVVLALLAVGLFVASPAIAGSDRVHTSAPLTAYDRSVPAGARAEVDVEYDAAGETHVALTVSGLAPRTAYAVRAHQDGCPRRQAKVGEVFQFSPNPDPEAPQDPLFRNRVNEVWLDVETDDTGAARSRAAQPWQFHPTRRPGSVMIHRMLPVSTPLDPVVGPALACLEVAF